MSEGAEQAEDGLVNEALSFASIRNISRDMAAAKDLVRRLVARIRELAPDALAMREQRAKAAARVRKWRGMSDD